MLHGKLYKKKIILIILLTCSYAVYVLLAVKAVRQFYQDASCQQEINRWLMKAQMSPQAWHYPWHLLTVEKVSFFKYALYSII